MGVWAEWVALVAVKSGTETIYRTEQGFYVIRFVLTKGCAGVRQHRGVIGRMACTVLLRSPYEPD